MTAIGRKVLAAVALLTVGGFAPGCGDEAEPKGNHQIWFMGSIYDGAMGTIIPDYDDLADVRDDDHPGEGRRERTLYAGAAAGVERLCGHDLAPLLGRSSRTTPASRRPRRRPRRSSRTCTARTRRRRSTSTRTFSRPSLVAAAARPSASSSPTRPRRPSKAASACVRPASSNIQDQTAGVTGQVWANDQDMLAARSSGIFTADRSSSPPRRWSTASRTGDGLRRRRLPAGDRDRARAGCRRA